MIQSTNKSQKKQKHVITAVHTFGHVTCALTKADRPWSSSVVDSNGTVSTKAIALSEGLRRLQIKWKDGIRPKLQF
jgi:hypothetical protein